MFGGPNCVLYLNEYPPPLKEFLRIGHRNYNASSDWVENMLWFGHNMTQRNTLKPWVSRPLVQRNGDASSDSTAPFRIETRLRVSSLEDVQCNRLLIAEMIRTYQTRWVARTRSRGVRVVSPALGGALPLLPCAFAFHRRVVSDAANNGRARTVVVTERRTAIALHMHSLVPPCTGGSEYFWQLHCLSHY